MTDKANKGAAKTPDLVWWPLGTLIAAYARAEIIRARGYCAATFATNCPAAPCWLCTHHLTPITHKEKK